jgi:hypothetical protein
LLTTTWACRWQEIAFRPARTADDGCFAVEIKILQPNQRSFLPELKQHIDLKAM